MSERPGNEVALEMDGLAEFLHMGGHAAFIWPSYAIVFLVLIALLVISWRGYKRAQADLKAVETAMEKDGS